jgi:hypothetical protein
VSAASLAYIDVAFCVDITSSMTPFIAAARLHMTRVLDALRAHPGVDLRVAIVTYRDHGTGNVVEIHPFAGASAETQRRFDTLTLASPPENTDAAEAAFSGLLACEGLPWRPGAYRIVVLVGDAPPHGCGATASPYPDRFPDLDPTGIGLDDMANRLEASGIFVHALAMIPSVHPYYDRTSSMRSGESASVPEAPTTLRTRATRRSPSSRPSRIAGSSTSTSIAAFTTSCRAHNPMPRCSRSESARR